MSDEPERRKRVSRGSDGWALPFAYWQNTLAEARERTAELRASRHLADSPPDEEAATAMQELATTFEELSVAEEELRVQNDELGRMQDVLAAERAHYHELFDSAPVAYFLTDDNGKIHEANRAAGALLHLRAEKLRGKPIVVFTHDGSRRRLRDALDLLCDGVESVRIPLDVVDRRGVQVRVDATIAAATHEGEPLQLRWLLVEQAPATRELAELVSQRTAELAQAQELKDRLMATVSHEFRTGLGAIGGYAELLETGMRGPLTPEQLNDVQRIRRVYEHLTHIVDDLLNYSRLVAGQLTLDMHNIVLNDVIRGVADIVGEQARAKHIALELAETPVEVHVRADSERLRQVLVNLATNAIKFTPTNGHVRVEGRIDERNVYVDVVDDGPGIPAAQHESIFQPFVRLRSGAGAPGTGLGLAISRDLARAMDGDLVVQSVPGHGSRFVLSLPRSTPLASTTAPG